MLWRALTGKGSKVGPLENAEEGMQVFSLEGAQEMNEEKEESRDPVDEKQIEEGVPAGGQQKQGGAAGDERRSEVFDDNNEGIHEVDPIKEETRGDAKDVEDVKEIGENKKECDDGVAPGRSEIDGVPRNTSPEVGDKGNEANEQGQ